MLSWYIWSPCNPKQRTQYQRSSADHWHCKLEKWLTCWLAGVHVVPFEHSQLHWRYIFSQSDTTYTIYTEPIAENFCWCKILRNCLQTIHKNFLQKRHWKTLKDKAKKQACVTMAKSSFCVEAFAITKVSGLPPWARSWLVEPKDSALLTLTSTTLECLLQVHWQFV